MRRREFTIIRRMTIIRFLRLICTARILMAKRFAALRRWRASRFICRIRKIRYRNLWGPLKKRFCIGFFLHLITHCKTDVAPASGAAFFKIQLLERNPFLLKFHRLFTPVPLFNSLDLLDRIDREEDLQIVVCFQPFMAGAFFQLPGSGRWRTAGSGRSQRACRKGLLFLLFPSWMSSLMFPSGISVSFKYTLKSRPFLHFSLFFPLF